MAGMGAVRHALVERLGTLPDFTGYHFVPDAVNVPCAFVEPDRPFVDYQQAFQGAGTQWRFVITILVNRMDEEAAQYELDGYLDPDGDFVAVLQELGIDDSLSQVANFVEVLSASRYGGYKVGGTDYLGAQLSVLVMA
jgi:hypothetical protein